MLLASAQSVVTGIGGSAYGDPVSYIGEDPVLAARRAAGIAPEPVASAPVAPVYVTTTRTDSQGSVYTETVARDPTYLIPSAGSTISSAPPPSKFISPAIVAPAPAPPPSPFSYDTTAYRGGALPIASGPTSPGDPSKTAPSPSKPAIISAAPNATTSAAAPRSPAIPLAVYAITLGAMLIFIWRRAR